MMFNSVNIVTVKSAITASDSGEIVQQMKKLALCILLLFLAGCVETTSHYSTTQIKNTEVGPRNCNVSRSDIIGNSSLQQAMNKGLAGYDWERIYQKCPGSMSAANNYAMSLIKAGRITKAKEVVSKAKGRFPDFSPLARLERRLHSPLDYATELADVRFRQWLNSDSRYTFTHKPPQKATPSDLPKLIKGEFEKRANFEKRVLAAKQVRKKEIEDIESSYSVAVQAFNQQVAIYNSRVRAEKEERIKKSPAIREQLLNKAVQEVLGGLKLEQLVYNSESEKFTARIRATGAGFAENVVIKVPLTGDRARNFKRNRVKLAPQLSYSVNTKGVANQSLTVRHDGTTYNLEYIDVLATPVEISAVAEVHVPIGQEISTIKQVKSEISIEDSYYAEALQIQDDPVLAKLRQEQAENDRKLQLARAEQAREQERNRIEKEILQQQKKLANLGGSVGSDYEGLEEKYAWSFRAAATPASDTVAIIIGNRNYDKDIPKVHYAYNDIAAFRNFLKNGLGVPSENIIVQKDATKGVMEGLFLRTLPNRITKGQTKVIVYFSGHGMPKNGKALLLPSDTMPEFADLTGYPRDLLLSQLAQTGARQVTVILDACFSGTAKNSAPLVAGKPVFAEVSPVAIPGNTVFISATQAREIARMDKDKGMSVMTFHLLQGLSGKADLNHNGEITVAELKAYLPKEVNKTVRLSFNANQHPEVMGPSGRTLISY